MGWFCTHLTTKNLKFVKIFKKTAKKMAFFETFFDFFSMDSNMVLLKGIW